MGEASERCHSLGSPCRLLPAHSSQMGPQGLPRMPCWWTWTSWDLSAVHFLHKLRLEGGGPGLGSELLHGRGLLTHLHPCRCRAHPRASCSLGTHPCQWGPLWTCCSTASGNWMLR